MLNNLFGFRVSIAHCLAGYCSFPCCHTYTTHHFAGRTTSTNQKFQQKNYTFSKCPDIMCESVLRVCVRVNVCVCVCDGCLLSSEHRLPPTPPALSTVCSGHLARHASSPRSNVSSSYQRISMPASWDSREYPSCLRGSWQLLISHVICMYV